MSANPVGQIGQFTDCSCTKDPNNTVKICKAEDAETFEEQDTDTFLIFAPSSPSFGMLGIVNGLFGIFTPFLSLVNSVASKDQNNGSKDTKITVEQFSNSLKDALTRLGTNENLSNNISPQSKKALENLQAKLTELGNRKDLQNMDLTDLVREWRNNRDTRALIRMAEIIQANGEDGKHCIKFTDKKLQKTFENVLRDLSESIDEIMTHPPGPERDRARDKACKIGDPVVDNLDCLNKRGTDENLTHDEKEYIADNFKESIEHIEDVKNDPSLSSYFGSHIHGLYDWANHTLSFLSDWFGDKEKSEQEKLCEEREEGKKQLQEMCDRMRLAKKRKQRLYELMQSVKQKSIEENFASKKHEHTDGLYKNHHARYETVKQDFKREAMREEYYTGLENEIRDSLPPSSVCNINDLGFDVLC